MELEALVAAYPDACFIQTHREPQQFMGSWFSLMEQLRSRTTEPALRPELAAEQLAFMSDMLDRAVRFREAHPELQQRWCDVSYVDLVDHPGRPFAPSTSTSAGRWSRRPSPPWRRGRTIRPSSAGTKCGTATTWRTMA